MTDIVELFGHPTAQRTQINWAGIIEEQKCPYLNRRCIKVRKSQPNISIGTCSVLYGRSKSPIIICPFRLLQRRQIFFDCMHLLNVHEPGNELHIIPEVTIPGGSVDYFLVSARGKKVMDFAGIELQTLDTTGTVWPARQKYLRDVVPNITHEDSPEYGKTFGMNWKMTAKTILIQLHHKVQTFEAINKHLALVIQDFLLDYLQREFQFDHLNNALAGDSMHLHAYAMLLHDDGDHLLSLAKRLSTDSDGIARCLGLQAEANVELCKIIDQLQSRISKETLLEIVE